MHSVSKKMFTYEKNIIDYRYTKNINDKAKMIKHTLLMLLRFITFIKYTIQSFNYIKANKSIYNKFTSNFLYFLIVKIYKNKTFNIFNAIADCFR